MKRFFSTVIYIIVLVTAMFITKNTLAEEIKNADVKYGEFTDDGVIVTVTFSQTIPDATKNKLISDGWNVTDKIATKTAKPGSYYMYSFNNEKANVTVPNKAKVGDIIKLAGLGTDVSDIKVDKEYVEVNGTDLKMIKSGETEYSVKISGETLTWKLTIEEDKPTPVTPVYREAKVTYGNPTNDGVMVTLTFSENIPTDISNNLEKWTISGNTATRIMAQGATAKVTVGYSNGVTEIAKVAVPITLNKGDKITFGKSITNLKSEDSKVVSVEGNTITANEEGKTTIVTGIKNNEEYKWTVTVSGKNDKVPTPTDPVDDDSKDNDSKDDNSKNDNSKNNDSSENDSKDQSKGDLDTGKSDKNLGDSSDVKNNDDTTSNKILSKTGSESVTPIFIALIIFSVISLKKYIKYKNQ